MRNKRCSALLLLCGILLFGGCGKAEEEKSGSESPSAAAESQDAEEKAVEAPVIAEEGMAENGEAAQGSIVLELDSDGWVCEEGMESVLVCTLHDFRLYNTPEDASIKQEDMYTIDAEYYMERSKFFTMQVDIHNIDFAGNYEDGSFNVSLFRIEPKDQGMDAEWDGSYPVYVSEAGSGETDYYHVLVNKGDIKTITIGFYVPVKDAGELCGRCRISAGTSFYSISRLAERDGV